MSSKDFDYSTLLILIMKRLDCNSYLDHFFEFGWGSGAEEGKTGTLYKASLGQALQL